MEVSRECILKLVHAFYKKHPVAVKSIKGKGFPSVRQKRPAEPRHVVKPSTPSSSCQKCQVNSASTASYTPIREMTPNLRCCPLNHPLIISLQI